MPGDLTLNTPQGSASFSAKRLDRPHFACNLIPAMTHVTRFLAAVVVVIGAGMVGHTQQKIYWGDDVPPGWTGKWPAELQTVAEQSHYTRTMTSLQNLEFVTALRGKTESLHVVNMFISPLKKVAPAMVVASPRVTSPQQARASGKPVIFLFGNIHPPESEAAEALQMVARDLTVGARKNLLQNQIVIIAPIFNVDGTDTLVPQDGSLGSETPHIFGTRENSQGLDLNRDGVKLETVEANGMYRLLNQWDPALLLDGHLMSRVNHGYANTYGTTTVPAAAPGPRDYTHDTLFPAVRDMVRKEFGLEVFTHALFGRGGGAGAWPPTTWSHDAAAWTVEAKFIVNDYGLRNRLAIITETPGQPTFERRIYAQYAYLTALLEYTNAHAKEIQAVIKAADDKTVADVQTLAESGKLRNFLDGQYESRGKIEVFGYPTNVAEYRAGTSFMSTRPGTASGQPETVKGVDDLTKPVGTREATVPRGYLMRPELADIAAKLRVHNIRVTTIDKPMRVEGEAFAIKQMRSTRSGGYEMTVLDGAFTPLEAREFPAGSFYIDMAQPMANAAFYYLEPQARDGFVGWRVLDDQLRAVTSKGTPAEYPIFKMRRVRD